MSGDLAAAVASGRLAAAIKLLDEQLDRASDTRQRLFLLLDRGSCQAALGLSRKAKKVS